MGGVGIVVRKSYYISIFDDPLCLQTLHDYKPKVDFDIIFEHQPELRLIFPIC